MSLVLIADTPNGSLTLKRILNGHELVVVHTMEEARLKLDECSFDLIIAGLHFDESHMFELIREIKKHTKNFSKPIISFSSRDSSLARIMHASLTCSTKALGAWMYLDEHAYNAYGDPDAELRRIMERCLSQEARKIMLQQRIDIHKQRNEIQQLRLLLQAQVWSPSIKNFLKGLRHELELLLLQVTTLQTSAAVQRASVSISRDQMDNVSEDVFLKENILTEREEQQLQAESRQSVNEEVIVEKEEMQEANLEHQ